MTQIPENTKYKTAAMGDSSFTGFLFQILLLCSAGWSLEGLNADGSLNRDKIQEMYFEGEFSKVTQSLETFRKMNPSPATEEKIFIYKYLSVVYAANPETREKGESYMYQLLKIIPTASLIDMYISDTIQAIFNKVRMDFEARMKFQAKQESPQPETGVQALTINEPDSPKPSPQPTQDTGSKKKKSKSWVYWTMGGAVLAGTVAGFILLSGGEDPPPDTTHN